MLGSPFLRRQCLVEKHVPVCTSACSGYMYSRFISSAKTWSPLATYPKHGVASSGAVDPHRPFTIVLCRSRSGFRACIACARR